MRNITAQYENLFRPYSALVFYKQTGRSEEHYVEHFDINKDGKPINAHPLSVKEADRLVKALTIEAKSKSQFLKPKGLLSGSVLSFDPQKRKIMWYTKSQKHNLFFANAMNIPNGEANVPAMLWFANEEKLTVFALASNRRPNEKTTLYHAPFFNVNRFGAVCMGTVNIDISPIASLEQFMEAWENYFFGSYFSHLINENNPVHGNSVLLWRNLIGTDKPFPTDILKPVSNINIQKLLS